jgi:AcrR family transcriptional regulator
MERDVKRRRYDGTLRRERADQNRLSILEAARARFVADGYARTSIAAVADDAGVSEDLVYKHFTNKRGLVIEVLNYAVSGEVDSPPVLEQADARATMAETDQRRMLDGFAPGIADRVARGRPLFDVITSAAEADPELAAKRDEMHRTRYHNLRTFVRALAAAGPLRDGLDETDAAATVWALAGPDMHRMLVDGLGWSQRRYVAWLRDTLEAALLPPT